MIPNEKVLTPKQTIMSQKQTMIIPKCGVRVNVLALLVGVWGSFWFEFVLVWLRFGSIPCVGFGLILRGVGLSGLGLWALGSTRMRRRICVPCALISPIDQSNDCVASAPREVHEDVQLARYVDAVGNLGERAELLVDVHGRLPRLFAASRVARLFAAPRVARLFVAS